MAGLLSGYLSMIADAASKKRDAEKLELMDGSDLYIVAQQLVANGEWPIMQLQGCMYLILAPSPYSQKDFINYISLDCCQHFVRGWVRQVLVKPIRDKRIVIRRKG